FPEFVTCRGVTAASGGCALQHGDWEVPAKRAHGRPGTPLIRLPIYFVDSFAAMCFWSGQLCGNSALTYYSRLCFSLARSYAAKQIPYYYLVPIRPAFYRAGSLARRPIE